MCVGTSGAGVVGLGGPRRGRFTRPGTYPSRRRHPARAGTLRACGDRIPVPDGVECPRPGRHAPRRAGCPRLRGSVPAWGDTHSVVRPRRRGTSLWTVSPRIEDVPFDRGLRSPTEGDGPGAVVWGRSTSWAQNAVPDGPGLPRGAVVETSQGRPVNLVVVFTASKGARCPRWTRLPVPGCSGIGFAPWLQDDASTPTPAPRPCASGPRSRARPTTNRPELGTVPTPPVPLTGPPDVG